MARTLRTFSNIGPDRDQLISDLLSSEDVYIGRLNQLNQDYIVRFRQKMLKKHIDEPKLDEWLTVIQSLCNFHPTFLQQMQTQRDKILAVFVKNQPQLMKYLAFVQYQPQGMKLLEAKLSKYMIKKGGLKGPRDESVEALLSAMKVRITYYQLFLDGVEKTLSISSPEREVLDKARDIIQTLSTDRQKSTTKHPELFGYVPRVVIDRILRAHHANSAGTLSTYLPDTCEVSTHVHSAILIADVSGFTKLNESFAALGQVGAEKVTKHLNTYFTSILEVIEKYGGDCIKFAGDALIVLFSPNEMMTNATLPGNDSVSISDTRSRMASAFFKSKAKGLEEEMAEADTSLRALQSALILKDMRYVAKEDDINVELSLHSAVAAGNVHAMHLGGEEEEWEFLITGESFAHLSRCLDLGKKGDVIASKKTWKRAGKFCTGESLGENNKPSEWKLVSINVPVEPRAVKALDFNHLFSSPLISNAVRAYVPACVLAKLDSGLCTSWLAELRKASVIFVNLKGLVMNKKTSNDPRQAHSVCKAAMRIISRNQGYRRQFLVDDKGSVLIVVFGVPPYAHEDDAYRAVKTAMELKQGIQELGVENTIGIATGNVYVGSVGSPGRQEHAVVGDTVNASARLSGKSTSILVDQATYEKTKQSVKYKDMGIIEVKGKDKKLQIYSPQELLTGLHQMKGGEDGAVVLLDRDEYVRQFQDALKAMEEGGNQTGGKGRFIFIEGPPGIGKSELVRHLYRLIDNNDNFLPLFDVADGADGSMLSLWTNLVEELFDTPAPSSSNVRKRRRKVKDTLRASGKDLTKDPRFPLLNHLLLESIDAPPTELSKSVELQPDLLTKELVDFIVDILSAVATKMAEKKRFIVMLIDGLHLLDPASAVLLLRVLEEVKPLVVVGTARPPQAGKAVGDHPVNCSCKACKDAREKPIAKGDDATFPSQVENMRRWPYFYERLKGVRGMILEKLGGLKESACVELLATCTGATAVDPRVTSMVMGRCEGNPLYLVELASHLLTNQDLKVENGVCTLADKSGNFELPDSVHSVVAKRVDSLTADESLVCKLAACFGRQEIKPDFLLQLFINEGGKKEMMEPILLSLQKANIFTRCSRPARMERRDGKWVNLPKETYYEFTHEMVRDVSYKMLLESKRRQLHLLLAELYPDEDDDDESESTAREQSLKESKDNNSIHNKPDKDSNKDKDKDKDKDSSDKRSASFSSNSPFSPSPSAASSAAYAGFGTSSSSSSSSSSHSSAQSSSYSLNKPPPSPLHKSGSRLGSRKGGQFYHLDMALRDDSTGEGEQTDRGGAGVKDAASVIDRKQRPQLFEKAEKRVKQRTSLTVPTAKPGTGIISALAAANNNNSSNITNTANNANAKQHVSRPSASGGLPGTAAVGHGHVGHNTLSTPPTGFGRSLSSTSTKDSLEFQGNSNSNSYAQHVATSNSNNTGITNSPKLGSVAALSARLGATGFSPPGSPSSPPATPKTAIKKS